MGRAKGNKAIFKLHTEITQTESKQNKQTLFSLICGVPKTIFDKAAGFTCKHSGIIGISYAYIS